MKIDLSGKRALVVGGGTFGVGNGIGRAICYSFASCGANVVVADRSPDAAQETCDAIRDNGGTADVMVMDVTDVSGTQKAIAELPGQPIDILHYNVGIGFAAETQYLEAFQFSAVLEANLVGLHTTTRSVLTGMRERGHGVILATSSAWSLRHLGYSHSFYAASKAGMDHFIRLIAQDNAQYGIRANSILPGFIDTPRVRHNLARAYDTISHDEMLSRRANQVPLKRLGQPDDVANMAAFLASDLAAYVTGASVTVDGGLTSASIGA